MENTNNKTVYQSTPPSQAKNKSLITRIILAIIFFVGGGLVGLMYGTLLAIIFRFPFGLILRESFTWDIAAWLAFLNVTVCTITTAFIFGKNSFTGLDTNKLTKLVRFYLLIFPVLIFLILLAFIISSVSPGSFLLILLGLIIAVLVKKYHSPKKPRL